MKKIKSVHEHGGHKTEENMIKALKGSDLGKISLIKQVIKRCRICQLNQSSKNMPKISTVRPKSFNEIVTVDLKINITKTSHVLWLIDPFSRLVKGCEVKTKTAQEVVSSIEDKWFYSVGCPRKGVWGDNGTEFANNEMEKLCKKWNISFAAGPPYSPWSNGSNERNHHSCDKILKKLILENPKTPYRNSLIKLAGYIIPTYQS